MFQFLYFLTHWLVQVIQPILVPLCFVFAWSLILMAVWSVWTALQDGVANAKRMHQIPCANCQFFTGDYHLKCTVHPTMALTEEAIDCMDHQPAAEANLVFRP
ncbi:hypothetical protein H6F88_06180 [Oculatella sp. FACHB-28]|uniref:hypothetical protein n=1 Tax=Cyanophyceae TaxID=3028117 RepID=UPI00168295B7|nr:hypothetical protein [Leptolyngbya sp. FACHB-541]MBD2055611.1 hypothetical protein [Oculatella sp. FACHB-28]MBD2069980.1 hypothetical protein [Leptolyngbya sp. FACHB-671]